MNKYVVDTNVLLNSPEVLKDTEGIVILSTVLRELETLERKKDFRALQYSIRVAKRAVSEALEQGTVVIKEAGTDTLQGYESTYADNVIVQYALANKLGIITQDLLMMFKAESLDIEVVKIQPKVSTYDGYLEMELSDEDLNSLIFSNLDKNVFGLLTNQYLLVRNLVGAPSALLKWTGEWMETVGNNKGKITKKINTTKLGAVETKDAYQVMAFDSVKANQVTMLRGKPGTGKTLIAVNTAWNLVEHEEYRMVIFYNPVPSKDSIELGFYPGDPLQKFLFSSAGNMMKAKFGGLDNLQRSIDSGELEILPFVDLRGWDSTGERPVVVVILEAQNLTTELLKMGLQRIDENSKVVIDGDFEQQIDKAVYENDNGMSRASEVLRGTDLYGEVKLQTVYRSRLADIADSM